MIESRKTEVRYKTLEPRKLLGKFIAKRVLKTWTEDFMDKDTKEKVSIERNEILFEKGTYIDQDTLAKIRFSIEAEEITDDIEVSNQNRLSFENENTYLWPYSSQVQIGDKKHKFLLYAKGLENAIVILKDYIELNYQGGFTFLMVKEFDTCVILVDTLKELSERNYDIDKAYLKDEISLDEYAEARKEDAESDKKPTMKFYKIDARIIVGTKEDIDGEERIDTFVVHTITADRAIMLIANYLNKQQDKYYNEALKNGRIYEKKEIQASIEEANIISVGCLVPKEFSEVYL